MTAFVLVIAALQFHGNSFKMHGSLLFLGTKEEATVGLRHRDQSAGD